MIEFQLDGFSCALNLVFESWGMEREKRQRNGVNELVDSVTTR